MLVGNMHFIWWSDAVICLQHKVSLFNRLRGPGRGRGWGFNRCVGKRVSAETVWQSGALHSIWPVLQERPSGGFRAALKAIGDFCILTDIHCLCLQRQILDGRQLLGGDPCQTQTHTHTDTHISPRSHRFWEIFVLWWGVCGTCSDAGGQPGTSSLVSAVPLLMALPYWVASSFAPSSLQHALQGSASNLSASFAFASSPCIPSNQSSGNTALYAERVIFVLAVLARESPTAKGNRET